MLDVSTTTTNGTRWRVMHIEHDIDNEADQGYIEQWRRMFSTFGDMPTKTREAVSVLRMHKDGEQVTGYGQRVSESTYWIDSTPEVMEEYDEV